MSLGRKQRSDQLQKVHQLILSFTYLVTNNLRQVLDRLRMLLAILQEHLSGLIRNQGLCLSHPPDWIVTCGVLMIFRYQSDFSPNPEAT